MQKLCALIRPLILIFTERLSKICHRLNTSYIVGFYTFIDLFLTYSCNYCTINKKQFDTAYKKFIVQVDCNMSIKEIYNTLDFKPIKKKLYNTKQKLYSIEHDCMCGPIYIYKIFYKYNMADNMYGLHIINKYILDFFKLWLVHVFLNFSGLYVDLDIKK